MSRHIPDPATFRCSRCGMPVLQAMREPTCHPDDGATLVASLSEPRDPGWYDPFFAVTMAETYATLPGDVEP